MDEMSSAQFRKTYAKLTTPTNVTANGHRIGTWLPAGEWTLAAGDYTVRNIVEKELAEMDGTVEVDAFPAERFNTRPFTPVPKHR